MDLRAEIEAKLVELRAENRNALAAANATAGALQVLEWVLTLLPEHPPAPPTPIRRKKA